MFIFITNKIMEVNIEIYYYFANIIMYILDILYSFACISVTLKFYINEYPLKESLITSRYIILNIEYF